MAADRVQFRPGPLAAPLAARGGDENATAGQVAARDLARYYDALTLALASVTLSQAEASLLIDVLNGTLISLETAQMLAAEVEDSAPDGVGGKWGVDVAALAARIGGWTLLQRLAVLDAVERFWDAGDHVDSMGDRLSAVGLVRRG